MGSNWGTVGAIALGIGVFGTAYFVMRPTDPPPAVAEVGEELAPPAVEVAPPPRIATTPRTTRGKVAGQTKSGGNPWNPPKNPVVARWAAPALDGKPRGTLDAARTIDFDPTGDVVVVAFGRDVQAWSVSRRQRLGIVPVAQFRAAHVAPDASRIFVVSADQQSYEMFDTTGRKTATYTPTQGPPRWHGSFWGGGFGPTGGSFVVGFLRGEHRAFHAVDPRTGTATVFPPTAPRGLFEGARAMLPVPGGESVLVSGPADRKRGKSGLTELTLATGAVRQVTGFAAQIADAPGNHKYALSADGRLVAGHAEQMTEVVNLQDGRRMARWQKQYYYPTNTQFTPDTRRLLVYQPSDYERVELTFTGVRADSTGGPLPDMITLLDSRTGKAISEYEHDPAVMKSPRAMGLSHDGTRIALADGAGVVVLDFETAFGVPPLPPAAGSQTAGR